MYASDVSHAAYFWSQLSPLFAAHATPAAFAAGVGVSSHLLRAVHTCVRVVSVLTSRPLRSSESSLPGAGVGDSGPSMPHSSSRSGVWDSEQATASKQTSASHFM